MDGIVFFRHYYDAVKRLPEEDRLKIYETFFAYAFDGEDRALEEGTLDIAAAMLCLAKDRLLVFDYDYGVPGEGWDGAPVEVKNGYRNSTAYKRFREAVLERDEYTCQMCGAKNDVMNVHHIKPYARYPELRVDVSNGITLCPKCHRKAHKHEKR